MSSGELSSFLKQFFAEGLRVPPYPATAAKLTQLVANDDFALADLTGVIQQDPMLAATVLRYANSPAASPARPVTALGTAVSLIGSRPIVKLAVALGVGKEVTKQGPLAALRRLFWRHAMLSAEFCRAMAPTFRVAAEEAFVCGLLHDFGKTVGLSWLEQTIARSGAPLASPRVCLQQIEGNHIGMGLMVADEWNLSPLIRETMRSHHDAAATDPMTRLVFVSDQVVTQMDAQPYFLREMLNPVPFLTEPQKDRAFKVLVELPAIVSAFDDPASHKMPAVTAPPKVKLAKRATTLTGPSYPTNFAMTCPAYDALGELPVLYMARSGLGARSPVALPEQCVLKFRLETDSELFEYWGTVTLCATADDGYALEVRPLMLGGDASDKWRRTLIALTMANWADDDEPQADPAETLHVSVDVDGSWHDSESS